MFRFCENCGGDIPEEKVKYNDEIRFCSSICRRKYTQKKYRKMNKKLPLNTATIGAIGEYSVGIDLLSRGYEVFRALSPACSCDLAVLKDGCLVRVEVRTGTYLASGKIVFSKNKIPERTDVYAIVLHDKIIYQPDVFNKRSKHDLAYKSISYNKEP